MSESIFQIGADGVDTSSIVEGIQQTVARKTEEGFYSDKCVTRAERANLDSLRQDDKFLEYYLNCMRDAVFVNIGDFEILERRKALAPLLVSFKRLIWKLLKFYTYRLWSQQNEVNGLLLSATEAVDNRYREKIAELEARIAELEK